LSNTLKTNIKNFSNQGYRTLLFSYKHTPESSFSEWNFTY